MISIMTWNTALTEGSSISNVLRYVKSFLDRGNTIAVLQQIPYKNPDNGWKEHINYSMFLGAFPDTVYNVFMNTSFNNGAIVMLTAIVTKMNNVAKANIITTNRESAVCIDDSITIYGLHAQNGGDNKTYLQTLDEVKADIFLGDFNAGDYAECQNREIFKNILKNHTCICNIPTKEIISGFDVIRKSCIDHVFVDNSLVTKCSNLVVHDDIKTSDHYPITFDVDI